MARDNQGWPGMARDNPDKCQNFKQIVHVAFRGQPVRMALIWQFSTSLPLLAHHRANGAAESQRPCPARTRNRHLRGSGGGAAARIMDVNGGPATRLSGTMIVALIFWQSSYMDLFLCVVNDKIRVSLKIL